jgi:hypothetical protein
MNVHVIVETLPRSANTVLQYIMKQGRYSNVRVRKQPKRKSTWIVLECDGEAAVYLLTELQHRYPRAYIQGWTEPA